MCIVAGKVTGLFAGHNRVIAAVNKLGTLQRTTAVNVNEIIYHLDIQEQQLKRLSRIVGEQAKTQNQKQDKDEWQEFV